MKLAAELSKQASDIQAKSEKLKGQAWIATWAWLAFVVLYSAVNLATAESLVFLELNEFGDFFAGVSAPLAFLWLVVGFYQQGYELRQNTLALNGQLEELRESVRQQKLAVNSHQAMVKVSTDAHEFAINKSTAEALEKTRAVQPNFVNELQPTLPAGAGGTIRLIPVHMHNAGHNATLVKFTLRERGFVNVLNPPNHSEIRSGGAFDFSLVYDQMDTSEAPALLRCSYRDAGRNPRWQDFAFFIDRSTGKVWMQDAGNEWEPSSGVVKKD